MRLRVLIVDDQDLVRAGFRMILERGGLDVVGEAADGVEGRATFPRAPARCDADGHQDAENGE
jgi:DNA-binding NarL/FixJ family response regulator